MPAITFRQLVYCQLLLLIICSHQPARGDDSSSIPPTTSFECETAFDTLWEVSSRHLCAQIDEDILSKLAYSKYDEAECLWKTRSLEDLLLEIATSTETSQPTVIFYSHGNWNSAATARQRATMIFRQLQSKSSEPIIFVLYSWPSEKGKGIAKDIRRKNERLPIESHHLARLLSVVPSTTQMSFMGFSFGCPLICGALHLERGGSLAGCKLPQVISRSGSYRLSLTAPAFDRCRLGPSGTYRFALGNVNCLVNLFNPTDPVLKRFRFIDESYSPVAAGYAGLPQYSYYCDGLGGIKTCDPTIKQYDCSSAVGRTHSEEEYICKSSAFGTAVSNLLPPHVVTSVQLEPASFEIVDAGPPSETE